MSKIKVYYFIVFVLLGTVFADTGSSVWALDNAEITESNGDSAVLLNGQWEFYWKELLQPNDFRNRPGTATSINVPGAWANQTINGEKLTPVGYGTYRTSFKIPKEYLGRQQALTFQYIGSAYRIWIDGHEYPGLGKVGRTQAEEIPQLSQNIIVFVPTKETIEVVIQVSNFSFREGGILSDVIYGQAQNIVPSVYKPLFLSLIQIGAVLIIGIYYLVIYQSRMRDQDYLYFGLFSIFLAFRSVLLSEFVVNMFFPTIQWEFIIRLEYLIDISALLLLAFFVKSVFPQDANQYIVRLLQVVTALSYLIILFNTPYRFTGLLPYYTLIFMLIFLYLLIDTTIKAKRQKREDVNLNMISFFMLLTGIIYDVSNYVIGFSTIFILNYVFFVFILLQAVILSNRYNRIHVNNQKLTEELLVLNNHLEEKIEERTLELREKNVQLENLQQTRTKILANIAHDIGSPLAGVRMYLQILIEGKINLNLKNTYQELINKLAYVQHLNNDLLELSKLESKKLPFHFEEVMVRSYVNEMIPSLKVNHPTDNVSLELGTIETSVDGRQVFIQADRIKLMQVMENLFSNAIKYNDSPEKLIILHCYIRRKTYNEGKNYEVVFEVEDNGNGISPIELPYFFEQFYRKVDGNIDGSGLGLAIVKEIIEQHGGEVGARKKEGEGSIFYFTLPALLK